MHTMLQEHQGGNELTSLSLMPFALEQALLRCLMLIRSASFSSLVEETQSLSFRSVSHAWRAQSIEHSERRVEYNVTVIQP